MDIKKRIQELSLDQKAKLYFMGLVRQGKIDTLPEDPKAAYVSMMMDKDDYSRSVSGKDKRTFMEPEDLMPAARARKLSGMEDDPIFEEDSNNTQDVMAYVRGEKTKVNIKYKLRTDPINDVTISWGEESHTVDFDAEDVIDDHGNEGKDILFIAFSEDDKWRFIVDVSVEANYELSGNIQEVNWDTLEIDIDDSKVKENRDEEDEENDRNLAVDDIPDSLREIATELGYLEEIGMFHDPLGYEPEDMDNPDEDKVDISYTDPGFRFYKMKVDGKRLDREKGTEYLKGLGIDMEIPRNYDESILDKIVAQLKEKGIDADHNAAFDPS